MSGNGQDAAAQAKNSFGVINSSSASYSGGNGHGGNNAVTHISRLMTLMGRGRNLGTNNGDVTMHDNPPNALPISGTPREHDERDLAAKRQRTALEAEQLLAAEQARAAQQQVSSSRYSFYCRTMPDNRRKRKQRSALQNKGGRQRPQNLQSGTQRQTATRGNHRSLRASLKQFTPQLSRTRYDFNGPCSGFPRTCSTFSKNI